MAKAKIVIAAGLIILAVAGGLIIARRHMAQKRPGLPEALIQQLENSPGLESSKEAVHFLHDLRVNGRLPGVGSNEQIMVMLPPGLTNAEGYPITRELKARKGNGAGPFAFHYLVIKTSADSGWQLQRAWHVDPKGAVEEYSVR